mmetsp:Transcript_34698/g.68523  ORF Transcript_34698/g.68523 Transcript_34698/m.68523 type:complete len:92 (-) Transcript_34698:101-376(-)
MNKTMFEELTNSSTRPISTASGLPPSPPKEKRETDRGLCPAWLKGGRAQNENAVTLQGRTSKETPKHKDNHVRSARGGLCIIPKRRRREQI